MKRLLERAGLPVLRRIDPERAHSIALTALTAGLAPACARPITSARLRTNIAGLTLPNPIGLAAGFDKNATALAPLSRCGFGFIEIGAATPRPQPGNPKPRLFRLSEDKAAINRFGFNNEGMEAIGRRLAAHHRTVPVGLNLGANKDSDDRAQDFASVLRRCGDHVDFATINVSSPNTERLRDLQGAEALRAVINGVVAARETLNTRPALFVKIAPDLTDVEIEDIAQMALETGLDGIVATNTTITRDGLKSPHADQAGGLSGAPLFERSTQVLRAVFQITKGRIPIIGVGGISTAEQAYIKIRAGASAVQLYTALVYGGISLATRIARDLDYLLVQDGYQTVADAVGADHTDHAPGQTANRSMH